MSEQHIAYDIVIRPREDGGVNLIIPDLGIFVSAADVSSGYAEAIARRDEFIDELQKNDLLHLRPEPASGRTAGLEDNYWRSDRKFIYRAGVITVLIAFLGYAVIWQGLAETQRIAQEAVSRVENIQLGSIKAQLAEYSLSTEKVERLLERLADEKRDIPDEQRDRMIRNIEKIVDRYKPFIEPLNELSSPQTTD